MRKSDGVKKALYAGAGEPMPEAETPISALMKGGPEDAAPPMAGPEAAPAPEADPVSAITPQVQSLVDSKSVSPAIRSAAAELLTAIKAEAQAGSEGPMA